MAVTLLLPVSRLTGASTRVGCSTASTWPPPAEAAAAAQQRARMSRSPGEGDMVLDTGTLRARDPLIDNNVTEFVNMDMEQTLMLCWTWLIGNL